VNGTFKPPRFLYKRYDSKKGLSLARKNTSTPPTKDSLFQNKKSLAFCEVFYRFQNKKQWKEMANQLSSIYASSHQSSAITRVLKISLTKKNVFENKIKIFKKHLFSNAP
jgi:hypothetical protein